MNRDAATDAVEPLIMTVLATDTEPVVQAIQTSTTSATGTISASLGTDELRDIDIGLWKPLGEGFRLCPSYKISLSLIQKAGDTRLGGFSVTRQQVGTRRK